MGFAKNFLRTFATARTFDPLHPRDPALARIFGKGSEASSGATVTPETVLGLPAVKRAIEILANGMMNKRCQIVRVEESGDTPDKNHDSNSILRKVNRNMLFSDWVQVMQGWACLFGNAVSAIEYDSSGQIELIPFIPTKTSMISVSGDVIEEELGRSSQIFYQTYFNGKKVLRLPENVVHIQGLSSNGYWGYNLVDLFRETFGGDIAARENGNRVFGQGGRPAGFVTMPGGIQDEESAQNFRQSIQEVTSGMKNAHKIIALEEGSQFQPWDQSNEETQFLGKLEFDVRDLANVMGIQAAKLGVRSEQSYNSLEMAEQEHQSDDMQSWVTKWEDELSDKLLLPGEKESHRFVFENKTNWIPFAERAESAVKIYHGGIGDRNESRKLVGLPPVAESENDTLLPLNMAPVGSENETEVIGEKTKSLMNLLETAIQSSLRDICKRLRKQAESKIKNLTGFISWVDSIPENQGAEFLHQASKPMVADIKAGISEILNQPGLSGEEFHSAVSEYLEKAETEFPESYSEKVIEQKQ